MLKKLILVFSATSFAFSSNNSAASSNNSANTASGTQINNNVTTISNTMARPTSLYELRRASFDLSTLRSPGVVGQDERMGERVNARQSMPLDFTPLPTELQKIVLGYLSQPGWHAIKNENHGSEIDLLFCDDGYLVAQSSVYPGGLGPVLFRDVIYSKRPEAEPIIARLNKIKPQAKEGALVMAHFSYKYLSRNYEAQQFFNIIKFKRRDNSKLDIVSQIKPPNKFAGNWRQFIMAFSPCENFFAATLLQPGESIALWDLKRNWGLGIEKAPVLPKLFDNDHNLIIYALAISPDLKTIAAGRSDNTIALYDTETSKKTVIASINGKDQNGSEEWGGGVSALTFSANGQYIASGSRCGHIFLWEYQPDLNDLK